MKKILLTLLTTIICLSGALSQTTNESEPNDSFEQANLVTAPVTIIAASGSDDDVDFFKLDLPEAGVVTLIFSEIPSNQLMKLFAYNSERTQIAYSVSPENGEGFSYNILLQAGVSYLKVYDYRGEVSSSAFHIELVLDNSDGCEDNNSFETACLISPDITIHPQIFGENTSLGGDDVDYYMLDLPVGGVVTFNLSNLGQGQLIKMFAYNSERTQIAYAVSPEDGVGFEYDILFPSGISYFKLYDYRDTSDSTHLDLNLRFDDSDGCEDNNSFETACLISPDITIHPQIFGENTALSGDDVDFYMLDLPVSGVVTFNLSNLGQGQLIKMFAYNSERAQIAYTVSPEDGVGFEYDILFPSGISYFKLYDYRDTSDSTHLDLNLSFDDSDGCEDNNSFETACLISPDITIHPQIFGENTDLGGDDVDYYMLDLPVSGVVTFNLSNLGQGQLIKMFAYNSERAQIAYAVSPEDGVGFEYDILFPSGISYFKLYDYRDTSDSTHLNLDLNFDDSDGCENNNSFETACLVEPDTILHPQLFGYNSDLGGDDVDYYKVEAGIILSECFLISDVHPDQYIRLYVYDEDFSQIGYANSPETGSGFLYCLDLNLDAFYFKLLDYNSNSINEPITVTITGVSALSVPEIKQNDNLINVYPNPSTGNFTITLPEASNQIQILNSLGQTVESKKLFRQEKLELELEKQGIYFIRIKTDKEILTKKIIISDDM